VQCSWHIFETDTFIGTQANEKFKDNVSRVKVFDKMKEVLYTLEKEKYSLHIISSNTEIQ